MQLFMTMPKLLDSEKRWQKIQTIDKKEIKKRQRTIKLKLKQCYLRLILAPKSS
jgi:hypothetical protein